MHAMAIHIEDIHKEPTDIAEGLPVVQIQQEGLTEVLLKEVPGIPGLHLLCQEPQVIVREEVQGPEAQVAIEVQDPEVPEAQGAIEVLEGPEVQVAIEVPAGLQDLLVACEVPVEAREVPVAGEVPAVAQEVQVEAGAADNNSKNQKY